MKENKPKENMPEHVNDYALIDVKLMRKPYKILDDLACGTKEEKEIADDIESMIELLMKHGHTLSGPHCKSLNRYRYKGCVLKELRPGSFRVFFFISDKIAYVLDIKKKNRNKLADEVYTSIFSAMKQIIEELSE